MEFLQVAAQVGLFINVTQFQLQGSSTLARIQLGDAPPFEEEVPILQGGMRLRFSEETAQRITKALQDGEKVGILIDDLEETIEPGRFVYFYEKLTSPSSFFQNLLFKGLVQ